MALLYGDWELFDESKPNEWIVNVKSISVAKRADKRKDRVEISPEVLSTAITESGMLNLNVVGWFHSHPHITALPSHVDLRTQSNLQMLDDRFLGMIVSCFNSDSEKKDRVQTMCFQSTQSMELVAIPFMIEPQPELTKDVLQQFVRLNAMLINEERSNYVKSLTDDKDTVTSPTMSPGTIFPEIPNGDVDLVEKVHSGSLYSQSLTEIMDRMIGPTIDMLKR